MKKVMFKGPSGMFTDGKIYEAHELSTGSFSVVDDKGRLGIIFPWEAEEVNEYGVDINDPIVDSVIEQFKERSKKGIKKYGTTLERNDLSMLDWLQHLQEELMDAVCYIEKLKQDENLHIPTNSTPSK